MSGRSSCKKKKTPKDVDESVITTIDSSNKTLRPALSTRSDAAIVAIKFTDPTMIVEISALKFVPAA